MGRTKIVPIKQPDEISCGPSALKISLMILGIKKSLKFLTKLCKTTNNGTSTNHLISAANKLGLYVMVIEYATLKHITGALRYNPKHPRATIVSYLYSFDKNRNPKPESGHWAMISAYLASKNRILLLDSYSGGKKSYSWNNFRIRWMDFDMRRKKSKTTDRKFTLVRKWNSQLMLIIAKNPDDLPKFKITSQKIFYPG